MEFPIFKAKIWQRDMPDTELACTVCLALFMQKLSHITATPHTIAVVLHESSQLLDEERDEVTTLRPHR